jgi:hypothetical protein
MWSRNTTIRSKRKKRKDNQFPYPVPEMPKGKTFQSRWLETETEKSRNNEEISI